jgi:hypothetical protein
VGGARKAGAKAFASGSVEVACAMRAWAPARAITMPERPARSGDRDASASAARGVTAPPPATAIRRIYPPVDSGTPPASPGAARGWRSATGRKTRRASTEPVVSTTAREVNGRRGRRGGVGEEIDRFLSRALERLGEDGMRAALRAAPGGQAVEVPGAKPEQRQQLARLARGIALGREGGERQGAHRWRVAERQRERAAERERVASRGRLGLPPEEPQREREGQRQSRGLRM